MSITDTSTQRDERATALAGLHELADFLSEHPDVPLPNISIRAQHSGSFPLVAWIDGLDTLDVQPGFIEQYRNVVRTFAGLDVALMTMAHYLGEERQVPSTTTELVPFTADEIRQRAAEAGPLTVETDETDEDDA